MTQNRKGKIIDLEKNEIREVDGILRDLRCTIRTLTKVAARLEKYFEKDENGTSDDEVSVHNVKKELNNDDNSTEEKIGELQKRRHKYSDKKIASKSENTRRASDSRRLSKVKTEKHEMLNKTVTNNIEDEKKAKNVEGIKNKFEKISSSQSYDEDQLQVREEQIFEKIEREQKIKGNVRKLKEKFEKEKRELETKLPKTDERERRVTEDLNSDDVEKVKRVLKYFQAKQND